MNIIIKCIKHFNLVNKHRFRVFKLSCRAGIPIRGLLHDLSKYSPVEFFEGVKYYDGKRSPQTNCRNEKGYSLAYLHHIAHNKHHFQYWEDISVRNGRVGVFIPYKYIVEAICDKIAAGMTYEGKEWDQKEPLEYWLNHESNLDIAFHPATKEFVTVVLTQLSTDGLSMLNKKYLKKIYKECELKYNIKR